MEQFFTNIDWALYAKVFGFYLINFAFYAMLIQTTIMTVIKGISSIIYADEEGTSNEIAAASILWSIFILIHYVGY